MKRKIVTISISDVVNMDVVKDLIDGLEDLTDNFTVSVFDQYGESEEFTYHPRCPKEA